MGLLVEGVWHDRWYDTNQGRFERQASRFRGRVTAAGGRFPAQAGRYRLYASLACPWAHRTLIMRRLKGLEGMIALAIVHWHMAEGGWSFAPREGVVPDPERHAFLHQVYTRADSAYTGRVTVPVLYDTVADTIVSNESAEILRMLGSEFDAIGALPGTYCPATQRDEIDAVNVRVYETVNNGVYRAGFATTQDAYEEAVGVLFESLDWLEDRLSRRRFLVGETLTEADIRLFTTLVRFDCVYHGHFKCNLRRLSDYPVLWDYTRFLYQQPAFRETVDFGHIKRHYYQSHPTINPNAIVPAGPILDWDAASSRRTALS